MLLYKYWFLLDASKIKNPDAEIKESKEVVYYACDLDSAKRGFQTEYGYEAPELLRRENW